MVVDISEGGCLVMLKSLEDNVLPNTNIGEQIDIGIVIPGTDGGQRLSLEVKNIRKDKTVCLLGGNFIKIQDDLKKTMIQYISIIDEINSPGSSLNEPPPV
jgi:c-di-GMP-binding flagellar brake protein YcgR